MKQEDKKYYCSGYAVVFESLSENLGGFKEIIHSGAITEDLLKKSDVFAKVDHEQCNIIARSNKGEGLLELTLDNKGLKYKFELPDNYKGEMLRTHIERGELNKSSFSFSVTGGKDSEYWELGPDGIALRHIYKISGLYDVAPCFNPAYPETSCYLIEENINTNNDE